MRGGGTLTLRREGARVRMEAERSEDGQGLYALERAGCWPQFWAEAALAFSFSPRDSGAWYCEQHPERLVSDPVLKGQLKGSMLCRKGEGAFSLADPFRTDRPLRLNALFCLSQVERWEGRPHLVWTFDQEGRPKIPNKSG